MTTEQYLLQELVYDWNNYGLLDLMSSKGERYQYK